MLGIINLQTSLSCFFLFPINEDKNNYALFKKKNGCLLRTIEKNSYRFALTHSVEVFCYHLKFESDFVTEI